MRKDLTKFHEDRHLFFIALSMPNIFRGEIPFLCSYQQPYKNSL